jgi:hypothetical protein
MFYISALDVLNHSRPIISVDSDREVITPSINLNNFTMPISLSITPGSSYYPLEKPEYFNYSFILWGGDAEATSVNILNVTKCKRENFPSISDDYFNYFYLNQTICIENQDVTLLGSYTDLNFSFLSVILEPCKNSTYSNITCAPEEEIFDYIKNNEVYFDIYFQDSIINHNDVNNPVKHILNTIETSVKVGSYKVLNTYFKNQTVNSDDGFLLKTSNLFNCLSFDYMYSDDKNFDRERIFVEAIFYASNNKIVINRRYTKIQEVLASIGGLANVLNIILTIICSNFSTVRRDEVLLNEIFDFDIQRKMTRSIEKCVPEPKELKEKNIIENLQVNLSFNSNSDNSRVSSPSTLKTLRKEKQFQKIHQIPKIELSPNNNIKNPKEIIELIQQRKRKYTLKFTSCEIIKAFFCFSCCRSQNLKEKIQLYNKSKNIITNFMDITYIMKKIEEFEKLKIVIFNSEQLALFNFISKEFISLNDENLKSHTLTRMKNFVNNKEDLANLIINFKNKVNSNEFKVKHIDKKLYDLISEDLK